MRNKLLIIFLSFTLLLILPVAAFASSASYSYSGNTVTITVPDYTSVVNVNDGSDCNGDASYVRMQMQRQSDNSYVYSSEFTFDPTVLTYSYAFPDGTYEAENLDFYNSSHTLCSGWGHYDIVTLPFDSSLTPTPTPTLTPTPTPDPRTYTLLGNTVTVTVATSDYAVIVNPDCSNDTTYARIQLQHPDNTYVYSDYLSYTPDSRTYSWGPFPDGTYKVENIDFYNSSHTICSGLTVANDAISIPYPSPTPTPPQYATKTSYSGNTVTLTVQDYTSAINVNDSNNCNGDASFVRMQMQRQSDNSYIYSPEFTFDPTVLTYSYTFPNGTYEAENLDFYNSSHTICSGWGHYDIVTLPFTSAQGNQSPTINSILNATINEGDTYSYAGSFTDPDSTSWTGTVNYGDGSGAHTLTLSGMSFSLNHLYKDNGTYFITIAVTDNQGATGSTIVQVTVNNVAPTVEAISASVNPVQVNTSTTASANFTDLGVLDTHTAVWDWGDGTKTDPATVTETNGSGSVSDSHTYTSAGVYPIILTVTDNNGGVGTQTFQYLSVYNPTNQGLFSAGQKYTSPAGAYAQNTSLTGTVHFGLSYKYQGTVPTGVRQFSMDFNQANLHFNATTVNSLVISSGIGTLTGTGTVNGSGTYNFLVTGSESANTIRIQIKDSSNNVIYDTQPGVSSTATPTTSVTAGTVLAH